MLDKIVSFLFASHFFFAIFLLAVEFVDSFYKKHLKSFWFLGGFFFFIVCSCLLFSCGNNKSDEEIKKEFDKFPTAQNKKIQDSLDKIVSESLDKIGREMTIPTKISDETIQKLKALKETKDEFKGVSFYELKNVSVLGSFIRIYLVKNETSLYGRLKIQYQGDDWLFIERIDFVCDGKNYSITPDQIDRDNGSGSVWEWSDEILNDDTKKIISAIIDSKETKMRYTGKQYIKDRVISDKEKKNLKLVYDILN